tara:strand:+ start:1800 stop:1982 length:183 start_codon:yes stop_codon:yes gene_type:complete
MPEYEQMVDKYLSMGYSLEKSEEKATEDWRKEADVSYGKRDHQGELTRHALRMASRRRVA